MPARNEGGYLTELLSTILTLKEINEVIIVEGGSSDNTLDIAKQIASENPARVTCIKQTGKGKFNAVLEGAHHSKSKSILIWDADGTVPLDSTRQIIQTANEEELVVIGDRLRGAISKDAMQGLNWLGNWMFAALWGPILRIRPTDIFCGTKIFPKEVFFSVTEEYKENDPYGDIALLFTARKMGLKVIGVPVTYNPRIYGESKMRRWSVGLKFFKLTIISYLNILKLNRNRN